MVKERIKTIIGILILLLIINCMSFISMATSIGAGGGGGSNRNSSGGGGGGGTYDFNDSDNDYDEVSNKMNENFEREKKPNSNGRVSMAAGGGREEDGTSSSSYYDSDGNLYSSYKYDKNGNLIDSYESDGAKGGYNNSFNYYNAPSVNPTANGGGGGSVKKDNGFTKSYKDLSYDTTSGKYQWKKDDTTGNWRLINTENGFDSEVKEKLYRDPNTNNTYCFDSDGDMITGWFEGNDGKIYYFNEEKGANEGALLTGKIQIAGKSYNFGSDGALIMQ